MPVSRAGRGQAVYVRAENALLSALPAPDYRKLRSQMEFVPLRAGRVLYEAGESVTHVFFPVSCAVTLMTPLKNGDSTGIALIGKEGLTGVSVLLEGRRARGPLYRAVVQHTGHAYRLRADYALQEFQRGGAVQRLMLGAIQAQIAQIAQFTICNRFHTLSKRLCSWLLHSLDRLSGDELYVTQAALSSVLGVRREGITEAETRLRSAGVIEYSRGHMHVTDRPALERRACECYAVIARDSGRWYPRSGSSLEA